MSNKIRNSRLYSVGLFFCLVGLAGLLDSCGSGDGGGGGAPPPAAPLSGVFIDSAVQGLGYTTSSGLSGTTDANGRFNYNSGDTVTFTLFGRAVCTNLPTAPVITGLSCFGATSLTDARVVNLSQLLLTLGGIPPGQNPIVIPTTPPAGLTLPATLNFSSGTFDADIQTALTPAGLTLVSEPAATTHLQSSFKTLSVTIVNSGTVTSSPAGINCTAGTCAAVFTTGTVVTLTATGTGFTGWTGSGCSGTGTCVVTLNADSTVTATFPVAPPPATLTISNAGTGTGTVACKVAAGAFGACAPSYPNGTALTLQATANSGSTFTGWSNGTGNATVCNNTTTNCAITLTANSAVTANFSLPAPVAVTATTATANGGGGTVQCTANGGAAGPCGTYPIGTQISIIPTPNAVSNFTGWTNGNGSGLTANCGGATGACNFTLTGNTSITANFNRPIVSVTVAGTGSVSSSPVGINSCTSNCSAPFDKGASVTLTASGANFTGWSGGGCSGTGTCVINNIQANTSVTATFGTVSSAATYKFVWAESGALMAIDPAAPTAPITVASPGVVASDFVLSATYDAGTQTFNNVQASMEVFARNGNLWRVNSAKNAGVPGTPANPAIQVSNETGATSLCDFVVMQTGSTSTARIVYEFAGADANCGTRNDNVSKLVPVLADVSTTPFTLPTGTTVTGDETPIFNLTTGQATAVFLTDHLNSNALNRLDLGTNMLSAIQANVGTVEFIVQDTSDRVFIRNNNTLYLYTHTPTGDTLATLQTTASPLHCGGATCSDGTDLFVFEEAGKVYRVPLTATSSANVATLINSTTTPLLDMAVTSSRLILGTGTFSPGSSRGLFSMPKTGGAQTTLAAPVVDNIFNIISVVNNLVYYQRFQPSGAQTAVVVQDDGGAVATHANSIWNGIVAGGTFGIRSGNIGLSKIVRTALGASSSDPFNGATAFAYAAASPLTAPISLGTVPTTTPSLQGLAFAGIADSVLLGFGPLGLTSNNAALFADTAVSNSLVRVPLLDASWNVSGL